MAVYRIALRVADAKNQKKLRLAAMGVAQSITDKDGAYTTIMEDPGNLRKLEQSMAEFNGNTAQLIVQRDGQEIDLDSILATMLGGGNATGTDTSVGMSVLAPGIVEPPPPPDPASLLPPMSPSHNVFTSALAVEDTAAPPPRQMVIAAPPPPPIVSSGPAAPPVSSASGSTSIPAAVELAQHMTILQQILAAKPATVKMLRFLSQPAIPPFQLEDYSLIRRVMNNKGTKMDVRDAGAQRVRIHIRGRGYQVNTDRMMPPEYRYVLIQTLPNGDIVRLAEGSNPKAMAWAIIIFEQGIANEAGWEARLGKIHGASINGVPPGHSREP
jgi:hypothetical protein